MNVEWLPLVIGLPFFMIIFDMKYSILDFNQEKVLKLQKKQGDKIKKLDITDLLILSCIADFMNRSKIIKYTIDDKTYFSIQYTAILNDLPILDIKKQALSDRVDKMVFLGVLEKTVVKNQSGTFVAFRVGKEYEGLLYSCTSSEILPTSSGTHLQTYSTTNHNTNITNNNINNKEKDIEIDKSISIKKKKNSFNVRQDLSYVDEAFRGIWLEWLDYKDEINKQYKTQRGATSQYNTLKKYANDKPHLANAIVKRSIEQSWDGLFPLTERQVTLFSSQNSPYAIDNIENNIEPTENEPTHLVINGQIYR